MREEEKRRREREKRRRGEEKGRRGENEQSGGNGRYIKQFFRRNYRRKLIAVSGIKFRR
jgi:hypothetical protein